MKHFVWLTALALAAGTANAADLKKVPRTIAKEPVYQAKSPRYCLLVFGEDASPRVWLVLDGDTLYIDRNGNGDLTEKDEKVALGKFEKRDGGAEGIEDGMRQVVAGSISTGPKTKQQLMLMQMRLAKNPKPRIEEEAEMLRLVGNPPDGIITGIILANDLKALEAPPAGTGPADEPAKAPPIEPAKGPPPAKPIAQARAVEPAKGGPVEEPIMQVAMVDAEGMLQFGDRPETAPIVHFGGPLQVQLHVMQKLVRGQQTELAVCIGTPGLGKGTFVTRGYQGVPADVYPVLDIEVPPKEAGKEAIKLQVTLKERC